jgi:hypothetical protein
VKTTSKKSRRVFNISIIGGHRGVISVRESTTTKQALMDYYEETLKPRGVTDPNYKGNTMQVTYKGETFLYKSVDVLEKLK